MNRKLLISGIALLLLLPLLFACRETGGKTGETEPPETDDPEGAFLLKNEDGTAAFRIVRGDNASNAILSCASTVRKETERLFGISPELASDWSMETLPEEEKAELPELLIGVTDRAESGRALAELSENGYLIRVDGNKLVVIGASENLTSVAVSRLMGELGKMGKDEKAIPASFEIRGERQGAYQPIAAENAAAKTPVLIDTVYGTDEPVLAAAIVTGADPSGKTDCTAVIQKALDNCSSAGGGIVFLPEGTYLIKGALTIPSFVVLQGDWEDPEGTSGPYYGTVLLAEPKELTGNAVKDPTASPLITLNANSGAVGLTVYYPKQDAAKPVPYGYTFFSTEVEIAMLKNITILNAYRGIGISPADPGQNNHELMQLEHIRVCGLETAIRMYRSSEVGFSTDVRVSPSYWIGAGRGFACADEDSLRAVLLKDGIGLDLAALDDEMFSGVSVDGYHIGIRYASSSAVRGVWGTVTELSVTDCEIGIKADTVNTDVGIVIANSVIEGSEYAILGDPSTGPIKLCGVKTVGEVTGRVLVDKESDVSALTVKHGTVPGYPQKLFLVPVTEKKAAADITDLLQNTLNEAGKSGGIVLLPAGVYRIEKQITVPGNVLLCGSTAGIFIKDTRWVAGGTVILSYVEGKNALILKAGSGLDGLRFWAPMTDPGTVMELAEKEGESALAAIPALIKGEGSGIAILNTVVCSAVNGVDLSDCDAHLVKRLYGCAYATFLTVGGKDGTVEECLSNPSFIDRNGLTPLFDPARTNPKNWEYYIGSEAGESFAILRDRVMHRYSVMIRVVNARNERIQNVFMYASHDHIVCENSDALLINTSADSLNRYEILVNGGSVVSLNSLRSCGVSCEVQSSRLLMYNRTAVSYYAEKPFDSDLGPDVIHWTEKKTVLNCDSASGIGDAVLTKKAEWVEEGKAALYKHHKGSGIDVILWTKLSPIDVSDFVDGGYLHLSVWITDASLLTWGGQIELTSSGTCDQQELAWSPAVFITHDGWNDIYLPFETALENGGSFDPTRANFFRLFLNFGAASSECDVVVDNVFVCR